jgi:hypothetical protein
VARAREAWQVLSLPARSHILSSSDDPLDLLVQAVEPATAAVNDGQQNGDRGRAIPIDALLNFLQWSRNDPRRFLNLCRYLVGAQVYRNLACVGVPKFDLGVAHESDFFNSEFQKAAWPQRPVDLYTLVQYRATHICLLPVFSVADLVLQPFFKRKFQFDLAGRIEVRLRHIFQEDSPHDHRLRILPYFQLCQYVHFDVHFQLTPEETRPILDPISKPKPRRTFAQL